MKRIGLVMTLVVLFSLLVGMISCTPAQPTTTPTETSTPTGTATATPTAVKPITISYADYRAEKPGFFGELCKYGLWEDALEALSDGRIKLDVYDAGSLFSQKVAIVSCSKGVADIAFISSSFSDEVPLCEIMRLPPLYNDKTAVENNMIYWFYMHDALAPSWEAQNLTDLGHLALSAYLVMTAKKPVYGVDDLAGLTLASTDPTIIKLMSTFGAIMQPIGSLDGFEALQKGIIDGGCWNWEGPALFGWWDAFNPGYYIDMGGIVRSGGGSNGVANLDFYNGLPADLRELVTNVMWRWDSVYFAAQIDASDPAFKRVAAERGIQYIEWSDEEVAKFNEAKQGIYDDWVKKMEDEYGLGDQAAQLVDIYKKAASTYVEPAPVPTQWQPFAQEDQTAAKTAWDAVYGPGTGWGMDYKAYPNQISTHELQGGTWQAWP